jgi:hypothetical protein
MELHLSFFFDWSTISVDLKARMPPHVPRGGLQAVEVEDATEDVCCLFRVRQACRRHLSDLPLMLAPPLLLTGVSVSVPWFLLQLSAMHDLLVLASRCISRGLCSRCGLFGVINANLPPEHRSVQSTGLSIFVLLSCLLTFSP